MPYAAAAITASGRCSAGLAAGPQPQYLCCWPRSAACTWRHAGLDVTVIETILHALDALSSCTNLLSRRATAPPVDFLHRYVAARHPRQPHLSCPRSRRRRSHRQHHGLQQRQRVPWAWPAVGHLLRLLQAEGRSSWLQVQHVLGCRWTRRGRQVPPARCTCRAKAGRHTEAARPTTPQRVRAMSHAYRHWRLSACAHLRPAAHASTHAARVHTDSEDMRITTEPPALPSFTCNRARSTSPRPATCPSR